MATITPTRRKLLAVPVMKIQNSAVQTKTGLLSTIGPRAQAPRLDRVIRPQETRPRNVDSMAKSIATAYQTISAAPIATPVIHSEPRVPKVEAATRGSRSPVRNPQAAGAA